MRRRAHAKSEGLCRVLLGVRTLSLPQKSPFIFIPREPYAPIYGWESGASVEGLHATEALIPRDSCLVASNNITAHYGQRWNIRMIGNDDIPPCDLNPGRFSRYALPNIRVAAAVGLSLFCRTECPSLR